jgi:hypothetical protein
MNSEIKVHLYLGGKLLDPSDYDKVFICCKEVDWIVNDIYERNMRSLRLLNPTEQERESEEHDST